MPPTIAGKAFKDVILFSLIKMKLQGNWQIFREVNF